jgi:hypothetical protein
MPAQKAKPSAKSIIETGIEGGKTVKFILSQIAKKLPDSKADESHVRFYANKMVRDGKLDETTAQEKYGCGKRGRKPAGGKTAAAKKPAAKSTTAKKAPATKKTTAAKKPAAKKTTAKRKTTSAK